MFYFLIVADLLLALGAALRLTRFIVADDIPGRWWIKDPVVRVYNRSRVRWLRRHPDALPHTAPEPRWGRYADGLSCPFCMSVWMSAAVVGSLVLAGGPGAVADWWRVGAGILTLAWMTGHIAAWAGDTED